MIKVSPETEILVEAARFGNKEIAIAMQNASDFRLGLEFEFDISKGVAYMDEVELAHQGVNTPISKTKRGVVTSLLAKELNPAMLSLIDGVVNDPTVPNGVEVVTVPMNIKQGLSFMQEMFEFIKKHGSTEVYTGLHVNLSYDGFSPKNFNPIKAIVLLDDTFFTSNSKYPARFLVASPLKMLAADPDILLKLADNYNNGNPKLFINVFELVMRRLQNKSSNINLDDFFSNKINQSHRRIEFRFPGGARYEERFTEISFDIINMMYVMLAGSNNSLRKEYLKGVFRYLSKAVRMSNLPFNDFADLTKRGKYE